MGCMDQEFEELTKSLPRVEASDTGDEEDQLLLLNSSFRTTNGRSVDGLNST